VLSLNCAARLFQFYFSFVEFRPSPPLIRIISQLGNNICAAWRAPPPLCDFTHERFGRRSRSSVHCIPMSCLPLSTRSSWHKNNKLCQKKTQKQSERTRFYLNESEASLASRCAEAANSHATARVRLPRCRARPPRDNLCKTNAHRESSSDHAAVKCTRCTRRCEQQLRATCPKTRT
jgi:hypothetical protein